MKGMDYKLGEEVIERRRSSVEPFDFIDRQVRVSGQSTTADGRTVMTNITTTGRVFNREGIAIDGKGYASIRRPGTYVWKGGPERKKSAHRLASKKERA